MRKKRAKATAKTVTEPLVQPDLARYQISKEDKTAGGRASVDIGDKVADRLRGKSIEDVAAIVGKAIDVEPKDLLKQYGHLNPGMIRMNLGNRLRSAVRAKEKTAGGGK
jgi:hypothetical protein